MYIIKDGVKRTIDLPFQIGLNSDEAEAIITQLGHAVEESGWWVLTELHPPMKIDPALDQAAPLAWTDPGNRNVGIHTARDASIDKAVNEALAEEKHIDLEPGYDPDTAPLQPYQPVAT